jgi:Gpi18-like mannosyltransferase
MPTRKTPSHPPIAEIFILLSGLALALLLRILLRDGMSPDYMGYFGPWIEYIRQQGGFPALGEHFANYTPIYLYLLVLTVSTLPFLPGLYITKLIPALFDGVMAFFASRLVRLRYPQSPAATYAFLAVLFAPTVVLNSAYWGQADSIYTTGLVACVYFLAAKKPLTMRGLHKMSEEEIAPNRSAMGRLQKTLAMTNQSKMEMYAFIAFGLALAIKLQALFLLPVLVILLLCRAVSWKSFLIPPAVFVLSLIPAWIAGRPFNELLLTYAEQAGTYRELAKNVPNLYQWLPNDQYNLFYPAGVVWTAAIVLLLCMAIVMKKPVFTPGLIVSLATLSTLIVPYLLPKMHDRYFYPADVFSILYAFYFPAYFYIPFLVGGVSLFSYSPFLFGYEIIPLKYLALVQLATILILIHHLVGKNSRLLADRSGKGERTGQG